MLISQPHPPRARTRFSGWRIVALAAIALGMTGPGQTAGVSVFIDPMMATLGVTRSQIATAYLVGTLGGALALPRIGRLIDDRGARTAMAVVGGIFGVVLTSMAGVTGLITLAIGFTGIRMFGQGALSLVAKNAVAPWFDRRRGLAMGATSAIGASLLSLMPLVAAVTIEATGWRIAWLVLAALVWSIVLPVAFRGLIDHPSDVNQQIDGASETEAEEAVQRAPVSFTRAQAVRTPMFWAIAGAVGTTGLISTALAFHQIDLLGEQGLSPVQAAANFLPQTLAALITTLLVGALVDRTAPRWVLLGSMLLLMAAMLSLSQIEPGWSAASYGMAIGAAGSATRTLEAASFPALFGLRHLGAIRGLVAAIGVASGAFGPLLLSIGHDLTGSYVPVVRLLLALPVVIAALGLLAPSPHEPDPVAERTPRS